MMMRRRLLPDMARLQTFESAARHGNFSRAAQELSLTQSAVSRQIKELEASTGLQLFERIRQRVVLSEAGERLLPDVRRLLTEAERLVIGTLATDPGTQPLRIATLPTFGSRWLVPKLGDFLQRHPQHTLTVISRDSFFNFEDEGVDLTIHFGQPVWPGCTATFLCMEEVWPVANAALAARLEGGVADAPLLHLTTRPQLWSHWFERFGPASAESYRGPRFDQFSMIIAAVQAGMGVGMLPTYLVQNEIASGELVPLAPHTLPTENAYYIVVPEGRQTHPGVTAFTTWILGQVDRSRQPPR